MTRNIHSRRFYIFFLILCIIACASVAIASDGDKNRTANVAVLLDLQGAQATLGRPAMNGFVLAKKEKLSSMQSSFPLLQSERRLHVTQFFFFGHTLESILDPGSLNYD